MSQDEQEISQIRSIYSELQGYLFAAPEISDYIEQRGLLYDSNIWQQFNKCLLRLNKLTGGRYPHFELTPELKNFSTFTLLSVSVASYRSNLAALILTLHADYFSGEPSPISKSESGQIVINQNINQTQSVLFQQYFQKLEDKKRLYAEGSKERTFLEKMGDWISKAKDVGDILRAGIDIGKSLGIKAEDVIGLLT